MGLTLMSFLFFTGLVGLATWIITRKDDHGTSKGYFLGGRSLTFPLIAGSLLLTNLSTEQMVGLNGAAFSHGFHVMVWEVVAVLALVAMALFFLPRFLKGGVATVPQYLEIRFDHQTQVITNLIFLIAYATILLPIVLYTGARGFIGIMDIKGLLGIAPDATTFMGMEVNFGLTMLIVWCVGLLGSVYALFGGLRTVAVSDTLNGIGLLIGGFLITYFAIDYLGAGAGFGAGMDNFIDATKATADAPGRFNSIGAPSWQENKGNVPLDTIFTGVLLLNFFYWCTNQQIIQRTFGASSLAEGQKGVLLTGALKLLGPIYLVIPGILAYAIFVKTQGLDILPDDAYGKLVNTVLPSWLTGFFAAVMTGAILSSFNSALNSTCTLFSLGLYKSVINKEATEDQVVKSGKVFGWVMAIIAMAGAPFLLGQKSIFGYLQEMNAIYFIPIFAVVLVGMLTKRVPAFAAKLALVAGFVIIPCAYFIPSLKVYVTQMHVFHFLGAVFAFLIVMMLVIGKLMPRETDFIQEDAKAVDMTPWTFAKPAGLILAIIVLAIYVVFADFSILA